MKIISKYKDYYDAGLIYGIDEAVYFKREQSSFKIRTDYLDVCDRDFEVKSTFHISIFPFIVGFCGQFFPGLMVHISKALDDSKESKKKVIYSYEDFVGIFQDLGCSISKGKYNEDTLTYNDKQISIELQDFEYFLKRMKNNWGVKGEREKYTGVSHIFHEHQIAYFVLSVYDYEYSTQSQEMNNTYVQVHPILKDYKFSQEKDAYTAFQEISMFLGNMNNPDDTMLKPDDKYIAYSKGFCSHSFKKKPTKSREKPCDTKMSLE